MTGDDHRIRSVDLPIPFGGSIYLTLAGRVIIVTSEGEGELTGEEIAAVADLLAEARLIRGGRMNGSHIESVRYHLDDAATHLEAHNATMGGALHDEIADMCTRIKELRDCVKEFTHETSGENVDE